MPCTLEGEPRNRAEKNKNVPLAYFGQLVKEISDISLHTTKNLRVDEICKSKSVDQRGEWYEFLET